MIYGLMVFLIRSFSFD